MTRDFVEMGFNLQTLESKKDLVGALKTKGGKVISGDVSNVTALTEIVKGHDTILSFLGGAQIGEEKNIVEAAKAAGTVKWIVPSQYGSDQSLFLSDPCFFAAKINIFEVIKKAGIDYTLIFAGYFYEFAIGPQTLLTGLDAEKGVIYDFGDSRKMSSIATSDIAKFVPEILLDPHSRNQSIRLEGATFTSKQLKAIYEQMTGKHLKLIPKDLESLKKDIEGATNPGAKIIAWIQSQLFEKPDAYSFAGRSDNWRYPEVVPLTPRDNTRNE